MNKKDKQHKFFCHDIDKKSSYSANAKLQHLT